MPLRICLFTRDLRLTDNPVLHAASRGGAEPVLPVFVVDPRIAAVGFAAPNRLAFLHDSLADLDERLRARGSALTVLTGTPGRELARLAEASGAAEVHVADDHSAFAAARERRLREALAAVRVRLVVHEAVVSAVQPGAVLPPGSDHYAVFTPYHRRWAGVGLRRPLPAPERLLTPPVPAAHGIPARPRPAALSPQLIRGGETQARALADEWLARDLPDYEAEHDALADDRTSRFSPYLHFGCLSPAELVHRVRALAGDSARSFERQLAWRDFHLQLLAARPQAARQDYRPRRAPWRSAPDELAAWQEGRTGYPLVDAGMRQLRAEGWMHNRARLVTASFLTKTLGLHWQEGAAYFLSLLVDGDVANNQLNWQWSAGTGTDTRPNRVLNPVLQARRNDPDGRYIKRWVEELAPLTAPALHEPWRLPAALRAELGYPERLVTLEDARARNLVASGSH